MLAIFDLGGFREYAALYGRLEGRDLLARVGDRLVEAIEQPATFYQPRVADFAAILEVPLETSGQILADAVSAVTQRFAQFGLRLAFGAVMLPIEAAEPIDVLMLADERLYLGAQARAARERRTSLRAQRTPGSALY